MTNELWLREAEDVLAQMPDTCAMLALDAVEKALEALADAEAYNQAHDAVELVALTSPLHGSALTHLL